MNPRATHLKIKIHTLADEARHIRREEQKALKRARHGKAAEEFHGNVCDYRVDYYAYEDLREHRTGPVRSHARSCQLAYGYLRGVPYKKIEQKHRPDNDPDWREIEKLVRRFGGDPTNLKAWREGLEVACAA